MSDPGDHLREQERKLWATYLRQEREGRRKEALATLREFIDAVRRYPASSRAAWVDGICMQHWGEAEYPWFEGATTLRHPLLSELVLPQLVEGYRVHRPHNVRWLALFSLTSTGNIRADTYDELRLQGMPEWFPPDLLREAIATDPSDQQAAHALIRHLEASFDYATHEVPRGVLIDDIDAFRNELDEFEGLIERYPTGRDYGFELAGWRLHCEAWGEYLKRGDEFGSYAEFLAQREV